MRGGARMRLRAPAPALRGSPQWAALEEHHREISGRHLRQLFAEDPQRAARFSVCAGDLYLDYSKHRITADTVRRLVALAERAGLRERIEAMFRGEHINVSEDRAVLHVALRMPRDASLVVDGQLVVRDVWEVRDRMARFVDAVRSGAWTGATGRPIRAVVNIGIGGSDLGPRMAYEALRDYSDRAITFRFLSNIDPTDVVEAVRDLDPAETLFIVSSKTFTTLETITNARIARQWLLAGLGQGPRGDQAVARHFVAVSTNLQAVRAFGIDPENAFGFWGWVGGRYSYDSAIGLSLMLAIGPDRFADMCDGFRVIDEHFRDAPFPDNLPVLQGLLDVWYANFFGAQTHAVLPYSQYLHRFPAYLQQLTMESNGKSVRWDGTPVEAATGEVFWGEPGTNGQHAFYQLLHQGTRLVPADFIGFAEPNHPVPVPTDPAVGGSGVEGSPAGEGAGADLHDLFMSNLFAQTAVLAFGRTAEEVAGDGTPPEVVPHKVMPGNRPSSTILAPKLTPRVLGELVALYEHTVFTEGTIWGIDSFDQWGVELGKVMARELTPALVGAAAALDGQDASTRALIARYREWRGR
jgi:glucose-6-phosphate isomerase